MQIPIILTKKDCERCHALQDWLKKNNINFVEKHIEDEEFVHQLLHDKNFVGNFCDKDGCVVNTPVVIHKGKYWFKELWGINGLREKQARKIFNVK